MGGRDDAQRVHPVASGCVFQMRGRGWGWERGEGEGKGEGEDLVG